jgi:glutamate--cysteine ligase
MSDIGISLRPIGIDPFNDARDIPLQLHVDRYEQMTRYFERIGPFGIRMMRQTASLQVSLDRGTDPERRWRLLNDLAPYLIAMFANSPHYLGRQTGHASFRARCWRMLDPMRTGVCAPHDDPADAYTSFALCAPDMMRPTEDGTYRSFSAWDGEATDDTRWPTHLTTLFPEVRPRGHFEVRSCDAIPLEWCAAPIVLLTGLVYDERAASEAALLAAESRALLRIAGERGLRDAAIARTSRDVAQLALDGARRLGEQFIDGETIELVAEYFARYTFRDRAPCDDWPAALDAPPTSHGAAAIENAPWSS